MLKKDYILRLTEQAAQALAAAVGLRQSGKTAEAEERLAAISRELLKVEPEVLQSGPADELFVRLSDGEDFEIQRIEAAALWLLEQSKTAAAGQKKAEAADFLQRSEHLFTETEKKTGTFFWQKHEEMTALKKEIEQMSEKGDEQ